MSFRNRYVIASANGLQNLTIPVVGGREQKTLFKEVRIDNSTDWKTKHWRSLTSAYSKAPFFEFYNEEIKQLIFSDEENLFVLNIKIIEWICKVLKINTVIKLTGSYIKYYPNDIDYRNYFSPKSFQQYKNADFPRYSQVFEDRLGFQPNLSIIDLLFCQGPNAAHILRQVEIAANNKQH